tara:strand:- start:1808 stop:2674 length:867 start_codon:yes stop_codon:yes gene_type:complete
MDFEILENMSNEFNTTCIIDDEFIVFQYDYFTFFNFVKVFLSLSTGTLISFVFVSFFLYYPAKIKFEKLYEENKELYEYDPFLMSYLDEYYELEETKSDGDLKTLKNKYLYYSFDFRDKTYKIVMNYNFEDESFDYYLNDKSYVLPFDFLDTISRIYCVKYECKNIYVDNYDNREKLLDSLNPTNKEEQEKDEVKNNIFYTKSKKTIEPKNKIIDYTSNKFKYKGLLKEFSELLLGSDIYDSSNKLVTTYEDLENEIFSVKKNDDFEVVSKNEESFISFKYFKNSIIF